VDFNFPEESEIFRREFRSWLEANLDERFLASASSGLEIMPDQLEVRRGWNRLLADARYAAISWPEEYGGRGAGVVEQVVFSEEMARAGAPNTLNPIGLANIAPSIMQWGTFEQKAKYLGRMLRGDDIWCQGFSEPDAGSDLASLQTRADLDGDHFVVNGQKIWNTLGHMADWCELLVRTDSSVSKHAGISALLVNMHSPGIEVRPLRNIVGGQDFNELFFKDVSVPVTALLGPLNQGWSVAMTTLTYERGGVASLAIGMARQVDRLVELARTTKQSGGVAADDPRIRQLLAETYADVELLRLVSYRAISNVLHDRPPGPESSIGKLHWTNVSNRIADVAAEILGPSANEGDWGTGRVAVRSNSIAGGTTQVNKNIVAQRILGLPRST